MYSIKCASVVFVVTDSSSSDVSASPRPQRNGHSRSWQCRASVGSRLLSYPQARLDHCCQERRSDRLLLRSGDVSEVRLDLISHVLHSGMRHLVLHYLVIKLVVVAAVSDCFCRVLIVSLILSCLIRCGSALLIRCGIAVGPLFSILLLSEARQSCWDFSLFKSVRRVVHDVLTDARFACVQHARSRAARGLLDWPVSSHVVVLLRSTLAEDLSVDTSVLLVFCFGHWDVSRWSWVIFTLASTLLLSLQPLLSWSCASWSVGTSRVRHVCTDRSVSMSCGVLHLCLWHQALLAVRSRLSSWVPSRLSLSLVPSRSHDICSILGLRDLSLLLDNRLGSASSAPCSWLCISGHSLLSIHSTIDEILVHLMQVRHQSSVPRGALRRCARVSAAVCSQEEVTSTSTCAQRLLLWQTTQELVFVLLRHSQCLIS